MEKFVALPYQNMTEYFSVLGEQKHWIKCFEQGNNILQNLSGDLSLVTLKLFLSTC